ncbi:hypothetical protein GJ744_006838 [Endocarpon pusillum]|uniref:Uncharacterized protein n=1 Tax=Endocarpon pusillum TaxID=364733 RepID=A0A8H7E5R3_9EURO|nr:hypothetical protein GJ744_006838 [Endocarpon pusillum]
MYAHERCMPTRDACPREMHAHERCMPTRDACPREMHAHERCMPTRDACPREMHTYETPLRAPKPRRYRILSSDAILQSRYLRYFMKQIAK